MPDDLSRPRGCVATFKKRQERDWSSRPGSVSCRHLEQLVDGLNLSPNIRTAHPPHLPLPDHVHDLVSLDRSPRRVEFTQALLGLHSSFDRSMILLQDVVQALDWPRHLVHHVSEATGSEVLENRVVSLRGVVARIVTGPHDANRQDSHLPMRYDTGRPRAIIRLTIAQPRTASLPCPAGLRARRPSPMMDL